MVPKSMNGQITEAPIVNPKAWGTLKYSEVVTQTRVQDINVRFDSDFPINQIVLKNNTATLTSGQDLKGSIYLYNNKGNAITDFTATTEGSGFEKNIRVTFPSSIQIGPEGLVIRVYNGPSGVIGNNSRQLHKSALNQGTISAGKVIQYTLDNPGLVSINLFSLSGARIGQIMKSKITSNGSNHFIWNGKTLSGDMVGSGMAIMQMVTPNGTISRSVIIKR
jgi:hypothetical protein